MTLCIAWRSHGNVHLASDSRLTFGSAGTTDCAIKVVRMPFRILGPRQEGSSDEVLLEGDIGLCFAGSAVAALMAKETISEIIHTTQAAPIFHEPNMDGIADLIFKAYKIVSGEMGMTLQGDAATCILFAGYCPAQDRLRAFRMETTPTNEMTINEVLKLEGEREVFGSGAKSALSVMPPNPLQADIISVLQSIIDDPRIVGVGGQIQYGRFEGNRFQPTGVARLTSENDDDGPAIHYWRAAIDLNHDDFIGAKLLPNFPFLDLIPKDN